MKNKLIVLVLLCLTKTIIAQSLEREVTASMGDFSSNTEGSLSCTVGESIIELGDNGASFLTQGFQQPFSNPLIPVEFGEFSGSKQDKFVKLDWFTYSERNSLRFDIERSRDGKVFTKIGSVKALGMSAVRHNYDFWDKTPLEGLNYYRLRQVDFDGRLQFSKIISIFFDVQGKKNWATVFPAIAKDIVMIKGQFSSNALLTVANILGMPVGHLNIQSDNIYEQQYNMSDMPNGTYFFVFKTSDTQIVQKIIKQ